MDELNESPNGPGEEKIKEASATNTIKEKLEKRKEKLQSNIANLQDQIKDIEGTLEIIEDDPDAAETAEKILKIIRYF